MSKKNLLPALLLALPLAALAQSEPQLIARYTELAGSKQNATSLVSGLRDGKEVKLTTGRTVETFTPPTGKMGYGNIDNALALAQESLADQGITQPTAAQLEAALMGGTIKTSSGETIKLDGILQMRADGKGWGQIAQSLGFKLGEIKRADGAPGKPERVANIERPQKAQKPELPEKPERPERPERPGKGR